MAMVGIWHSAGLAPGPERGLGGGVRSGHKRSKFLDCYFGVAAA